MNLTKIFILGFICYINISFCSVHQTQPSITSQNDSAINNIITLNNEMAKRIPNTQGFILNYYEVGGLLHLREFWVLNALNQATPKLKIEDVFGDCRRQMFSYDNSTFFCGSNVKSVINLKKHIIETFEEIKEFYEQLEIIKKNDVLDKSVIESILTIMKTFVNPNHLNIIPNNVLMRYMSLISPYLQNLNNFTNEDFDKIKDSTFKFVDQLIILFKSIYSYKKRNELYVFGSQKIKLASDTLSLTTSKHVPAQQQGPVQQQPPAQQQGTVQQQPPAQQQGPVQQQPPAQSNSSDKKSENKGWKSYLLYCGVVVIVISIGVVGFFLIKKFIIKNKTE